MSAVAASEGEFGRFIRKLGGRSSGDDRASIPCPLSGCKHPGARANVLMIDGIPQVKGDDPPSCGCPTGTINIALKGTWANYSNGMPSKAPTAAPAPPPTPHSNGNGHTPSAPLKRTTQAAPKPIAAPEVKQQAAEDEIHNTDLGNAKRLVQQHGGDLRYSAGLGWLVWDHNRWVQDKTQEVMRRAKKTALALYNGISDVEGKKEREELISWAKQSESRPKLESMVRLAESEEGIPVRDEELDRDPFLLNVINGVLDLRTGELMPHLRDHLLTKLAPIVYDPQATCPTFDAYIHAVLKGNEELIKFTRRGCGYTLTGDVSEQVLLFLYGMGANGKSTLLQVLLALLGDYATQAAPGLLLDRRGDRHTTDIAELRGKRLVVATEIGEGKKLAEELVKQMTGGDRMKGRFMRCDNIEFTPEFKVWLSANHKPVIKGTDHAIWRRIPLIPFEQTFTDDAADPRFKKDPHLLDKLMGELPGILSWAVQGCLEWQREGLNAPETVRKATAAYRAEMDVLGNFIEECCILKPDARVSNKALRSAYIEWCRTSGEPDISQRQMSDRLKERGLESRRSGQTGATEYHGIGLLNLLFPDGPSAGTATEGLKDTEPTSSMNAHESVSCDSYRNPLRILQPGTKDPSVTEATPVSPSSPQARTGRERFSV